MKDIDRAKSLGLTLDEFHSLVGFHPLDLHSEFLFAAKHPNTSGAMDYSLKDEYSKINDKIGVPYETDEDVKNKVPREIEHYWKRPVVTHEDKALYYGYHVHSKDNVYGLHAHYPGGPLGGGHRHGPQNPLGYHTHRYNQEELVQFKFTRPGLMIQLDGPHEHQQNAPDGAHMHQEENFGPELIKPSQDVKDMN